MSCKTCPFAHTDESEYLLNLGCLPEQSWIIDMHVQSGHLWSCHQVDDVKCKGTEKEIARINQQRVSEGKEVLPSTGKLISYDKWVHDGQEEAIRQAK